MDVLKYVVTDYPIISPTDLATRARALLRDLNLRILPVIKDDLIVGIVSRLHILTITSTRSNLLVRDIMEEPKIILKSTDDVIDSLRRMLKIDEWYAPVVSEENKYVGIFGLESIIKNFYNKEMQVNKKQVSEIMTKNVITVSVNEEIPSILYKMLKYKYAGLPVVDNKKRVMGIITQHDLLKSGFTRILRESERASSYKGIKAYEIMNREAYKVLPNATIGEVAKIIVEKDVGRVIIVNSKNKLLGIVDREDVAKAYIHYM